MRVELRSVNHRHLNLNLKVPYEFGSAEAEIKSRLRGLLARGHISMSARWTEEREQNATLSVDLERARAILDGVQELKSELGLTGEVDIGFLARQPGIFKNEEAAEEDDGEVVVSGFLSLVESAAHALIEMRRSEGAQLKEALSDHISVMEKSTGVVSERAPARLGEEKARLESNIQELVGDHQVDEARLAQEVAHMADRLDITEELTRLRSHFQATREAIESGEAVGRRLSFLSQEILREVNTIGSKANDSEIAASVIDMKAELEKFKEQVENVE